MKVKNIAFFGFMAAIMLSMTGAANAAVQIASQAYVDAQDRDTITTAVNQAVAQVENKGYLTEAKAGDTYLTNMDAAATYVTQEGATRVVQNTLMNTETITQILTDTENGLGKELASKADKSEIPTKTSELTNDSNFITINDMNTAIDNIDLSGYQTIANISQTLNDLSDEQKAQKYPSVAAVLEAIAGLDLGLTSDQVKDLQDLLQSDGIISQVSSLRGDIDKLNGTGEGSVEKSIVDALGDLGTGNTTVADALADKADTSAVDANTAAITKLNGDETVNGSVANTVKGMTVPKPTIDCGAGKMCVLSIGTDGNPVWIDVTQPYGE